MNPQPLLAVATRSLRSLGLISKPLTNLLFGQCFRALSEQSSRNPANKVRVGGWSEAEPGVEKSLGPEGFEPSTAGLKAQRSTWLSYGPRPQNEMEGPIKNSCVRLPIIHHPRRSELDSIITKAGLLKIYRLFPSKSKSSCAGGEIRTHKGTASPLRNRLRRCAPLRSSVDPRKASEGRLLFGRAFPKSSCAGGGTRTQRGAAPLRLPARGSFGPTFLVELFLKARMERQSEASR